MNAYLVRTANPGAYDPQNYAALIERGSIGADTILEIVHIANPLIGGDTLIGGWESEAGKQVETPNISEYESIRPLGNYPGGCPTRHLKYGHVDGWPLRQLGIPDVDGNAQLYPETNDPFDLEIRHKEFPGADHGWRAEMHGESASRDPSVRAIAWYGQVGCVGHADTTGAFVKGPSDWQLDENGDPIDVWFSESPPGHRAGIRQEWHLAILYASLKEGCVTLGVESDGVRYLFWENDQPAPPGGAEWVDTGALVVSSGGAGLYYIDSAAVAAELIPEQQIRLGDNETVFKQIWPGTDDLIQIDPHVTANAGDIVWKWA